MKEKTKRSLTLFVKKAKKLQRFGLIEHITTTDRGFHIGNADQPNNTIVEFDLPDEKERDASLLTLRMFIQQNESFSFHRFESLANDPTLSGEFRNQLLKMRQIYFDYINDYPKRVQPGFFEEGTHPSRHEILKIVMNGGLSHAKDYEAQQKYKLWTRDYVREPVLLQEFSEIILNILIMIIAFSEPIERELSRDTTTNSTG